jgi:hypothetical protein
MRSCVCDLDQRQGIVCYATPSAVTVTSCDPFAIPSTSHWTGAAISSQTRAEVGVPSLGELQAQFPARLQRALDQALDLLDELREDRGEKPTVTVALHTSRRELDSEAALDRFLGELREQLLKELQSGHRVRLK